MTRTAFIQRLQRLLALLLLIVALPAAAQGVATATGKTFDHLSTGFALTGAHSGERCEACHLNGQFKGTPRDCASCHTSGMPRARANITRSASHLPTNASCDSCHNTRDFNVARFSHSGVSPGSCQTCHNGSTAAGKPANHLATSASCDSCHGSQAWSPAKGFDHAGVLPGSCASCHGPGGKGSQKPASHIPTTAVPGLGSGACDSCHKSGFRSWLPARVHANASISSQCSSCHNGSFPSATAKPANALHAGVSACENCHGTSSWSGAKVDHKGFTQATNCASCHNGSTATGKSATHIPVGASNCSACHATTGWKPSQWNHSQTVVTAQCASCHTGSFPPADGKPANHLPYTLVSATAGANCDSCHKAGHASWLPARVHANFSLSNQCASCHTGNYPGAVGKPATPVHSGVSNCENCHTPTGWSGAKVDHKTYNQTTNCASCHNGSTATGKTASHIPVGLTNCYACHSVSAWKPSKWNHSQTVVTAQCASCHSGSTPPADGKPANHVPYALITASAAANCDTCHRSGYASWGGARFHTSVSVSNQCSTCHTGAYLGAVGKPATPVHVGVTACESCHKTTGWTGGKVDHSSFGAATNCSTCHNGSSATAKPASHIPVGTTNCYSCHSTTAWKPSKWNHTQTVVTAQCAACHSGSTPPADGKPANHVPYTLVAVSASANCDACHNGSTSTWSNGKFHSNFSTATQCASCHTGSYLAATGKPATAVHQGVTTCESCHKSTSSWQSVQFKHSAANQVGSGTCDTCHNGSTAKGKPSGHVPILVSTARCDACHKSQAAWSTSVTVGHSSLTGQSCKSCHVATYASQGAGVKPANHIPESQLLNGAAMDCGACHTSTSNWGTARMNHNNSMGGGAGWCKSCHASGTAYLGNMERKSLTHEAKGKTPIDCSESGCHRPLGSKGKTFVEWD
ncbi:cytochrome c3 family protein [Ideonella sp.]|uniref:cytochrome c3 family protein n=1 Tax=Ideonella sp. TaxID=1929293 RepID=UPI003BB72542